MANLKACLDAGKIVLFAPTLLTIPEGCVTFRRTLRSLVENGFTDIILDLSTCENVDSGGIGELVSAYTFLRRENGSFNLNNLTPNLRDLLTITKLLSVFNTYTVDYSNYDLIDISREDLSAVQKAIALSRLDTLQYLLTLGDGKIQILPSQREGIFRLSLADNPSAELIIAAPYVIANVTRSYIRDEIEEFEALINSPLSSEYDIQKFIETHPKFLLGQDYQRPRPQVVLEREGQGSLIPDFLLQPFNQGFCDIVELKLPNAPLIVGKKDRQRFSSAIAEASAQLRTYRDYFDDTNKRKAIRERYGITAFRPKLAVIVGKAAEVDDVTYKQIQTSQDIQVITYDDLVQRAKNFLLL
jgi:anti-sigma B factor antagonist